jgi:hypothetical protein
MAVAERAKSGPLVLCLSGRSNVGGRPNTGHLLGRRQRRLPNVYERLHVFRPRHRIFVGGAREGRFDYLLVESTGISGPLPAAGPRLGRRTALTFPLLPPPQKN